MKHTAILTIDIYHYLSDIYDYYMRHHLKRLRSPRENDYSVCYLIYDKITNSQRLIRSQDYKTLTNDINDSTQIVLLSFTRNDISTSDIIPPSTPRSAEADRLYCILNRHTLSLYFRGDKPDLEKMRNSTTEDIMYVGLKVGDEEYNIYDHFKKYMITGNKIDNFVIKQMMSIYYPTYPKIGELRIMTTNFETIEYYTDFSFVV
jgi:hypothetical protein